MHKLLLRAIITGFGLRVGAELGKLFAHKVLPKEDKPEGEGEDEDEDESLGSVTADPPEV